MRKEWRPCFFIKYLIVDAASYCELWLIIFVDAHSGLKLWKRWSLFVSRMFHEKNGQKEIRARGVLVVG